MAKGFKHGAGGIFLNFKVVGNPQPETANENTIWVDTDKINNYYFSATQPENMVDYDMWFIISTASTVAFSATKKNPIMVYPLSAKQYIGGVLVDKTAKSYQGGEWVDWWHGELFINGNQYESITGGWARSGAYTNDDHPNTGSVSIGNVIKISSTVNSPNNCAVVSTVNPIDITNFKKLYVIGKNTDNTYSPNIAICISERSSGVIYGTDFAKASIAINSMELTTADTSIEAYSGKHYIHVYVERGRAGEIHEIWLQ